MLVVAIYMAEHVPQDPTLCHVLNESIPIRSLCDDIRSCSGKGLLVLEYEGKFLPLNGGYDAYNLLT